MPRQVPSTLYIMHVMHFTRLLHFSARIIEKLRGDWLRGYHYPIKRSLCLTTSGVLVNSRIFLALYGIYHRNLAQSQNSCTITKICRHHANSILFTIQKTEYSNVLESTELTVTFSHTCL